MAVDRNEPVPVQNHPHQTPHPPSNSSGVADCEKQSPVCRGTTFVTLRVRASRPPPRQRRFQPGEHRPPFTRTTRSERTKSGPTPVDSKYRSQDTHPEAYAFVPAFAILRLREAKKDWPGTTPVTSRPSTRSRRFQPGHSHSLPTPVLLPSTPGTGSKTLTQWWIAT